MTGLAGVARVVIADDHPLFRAGLGYALRAQGFDVAAEASNGAEAVRCCRLMRPHAVLLDVKMPVIDGVKACREIVGTLPAVRVVLLTTFAEPALVEAARDAGAAGFVSKETDAIRLGEILRGLIADPAARVFPAIVLPRLTHREREVLAWLVEGLTNKEIARRLMLSPETVKDHVLSLYRKLEVTDRVGAAGRARDLGLV